MARQRITGTWAAIPTPLTAGGGLDAPMLGRFAAELLLRGCSAITGAPACHLLPRSGGSCQTHAPAAARRRVLS